MLEIRRNYPSPSGIFRNFLRAEGPREISKNSRGRGVISANSRQNQEFLINFGFYTSSALSKRISHLCWPAVVSIFCTFVSIQGYQSSTRVIVQNTIFNINSLTNILQVSKIANSSRFEELFMRQQNLISEQNHIAAKFLDMLT